MRNPNHGFDAVPPIDEQPTDDDQIRSLTLDDQIILYDVDDIGRWIQSNATVDLADTV